MRLLTHLCQIELSTVLLLITTQQYKQATFGSEITTFPSLSF